MALADGPQRWGELKRSADGISEKMLAQTLRTLTTDDLVARESFPEVPPRVVYSLTPRGRELSKHLLPLMGWIHRNADAMLSAATHEPRTEPRRH